MQRALLLAGIGVAAVYSSWQLQIPDDYSRVIDKICSTRVRQFFSCCCRSYQNINVSKLQFRLFLWINEMQVLARKLFRYPRQPHSTEAFVAHSDFKSPARGYNNSGSNFKVKKLAI